MSRNSRRARARRDARPAVTANPLTILILVVLAICTFIGGILVWRSQSSASDAVQDSRRELAAGDLAAAARDAQRAVDAAPTSASAEEQLGSVKASQGDHVGAYAAYQRAKSLDPGNRDYLIAMATEGLYGMDLANQEKILDDYVDEHPDDGEATYLLAATQAVLPTKPDAYQMSETNAKRAESLLPGDPRVEGLLGNLFISGNDLDQALTCFQAALDKDPNNVAILRDALFCYLMQGRTADANDMYDKLAYVDPDCKLDAALPDIDSTVKPPPSTETGDANAKFVDVAKSSGIDYLWHCPGALPRSILSTIGYGVAFLDYNNDGNLDILLVGPRPRLYEGDGHGHFTDVTHQVGLDRVRGYFSGCAIGDYDNDGYDDIFLTGYHTAALLHNEHGFSFKDVTAQSGIKTDAWSTSAAWGDIDNDGKLDLYVCNYIDFKPTSNAFCNFYGYISGCGPNSYGAEAGVLYHNDGNGHFTDITKKWGANRVDGKDLGVAFADYDGSGKQSLIVANDQTPADLFHSGGSGYEQMGVQSGVAFREDGKPFSGMGVDWGDYDNDGKLDLAIMDFQWEDKRILHNDGGGIFTNRFEELGMHPMLYPWVSFGVKWIDYDNDGWLDLIVSDGHTSDNIHDRDSSLTFTEPIKLLHNNHGTSFSDASGGLAGNASVGILGRGLAIGDFDNDGRVDALVVNAEGAPLLLHNETANAGHWLEIALTGTKSNRDGYGALVTASAGGLNRLRLCHADGSYMSSSDKRVHIGLGESTSASLSIRWPSGTVDKLTNVPADRIIHVTEGSGTWK